MPSTFPAFVAAFALAFTLSAVGTAGAYHTRFVADNCNYNAPTPTSYITRDGSTTVALRARYEGYQVGGRLLERQRPGRLAGRPHGGSEHRRRGPRLLRLHLQGLAGVDLDE